MGRLTDFFTTRGKAEKTAEKPALKKSEAESEQAFAVPYSNRQPWNDDSLVRSLEIAEAVKTDIVKNSTLKIRSLLSDMLDALGKGFSVNELIWETSASRWKPVKYIYRQPNWFQYDKNDGRTLKLRDAYGSELTELSPYKFIIHEPHLISGTQITAGFAFIALYFWMLKNYDVSSWAAFIDRFGYPIRLGKYGKKADEKDIATLKRAVASIGADNDNRRRIEQGSKSGSR